MTALSLTAALALIDAHADALQREAVNTRRELHALAEPGFHEWRTLQYVLKAVKDLPLTLEFLPEAVCKDYAEKAQLIEGHTVWVPGLKATFNLGGRGAHAALRCDLDALPIAESSDETHLPARLGFACTSGCMHACGHDGHLAMALTLIKFLSAHLPYLKASGLSALSFIFQGAEEGCAGARLWTESSLLDDLDELYCLHLGMGLPSGSLAPAPDGFLATLKFDLTVQGRKAHAGRPELGVNALYCLTHFIEKARQAMDLEHRRLINFGSVSCTGARNVVPDLASAQGEIRALSDADLAVLKAKLQETAAQCQALFPGAVLQFTKRGEGSTISQDGALAEAVSRAASAGGLKLEPYFSFKASEDASLLIKKVQSRGGHGLYSVLGTDLAAGHHQSTFDFDESVLLSGIRTYAALFLSGGAAVLCA